MNLETDQEENLDGLEIGTSITSYDKEGNVTYAQFRPKLLWEFTKELEAQLKTIHSEESVEVLKENSDMVFANWWNTLSTMELADRNKYSMVSEVVHCEKYPNGKIMDCYIKYTFKKL